MTNKSIEEKLQEIQSKYHLKEKFIDNHSEGSTGAFTLYNYELLQLLQNKDKELLEQFVGYLSTTPELSDKPSDKYLYLVDEFLNSRKEGK